MLNTGARNTTLLTLIFVLWLAFVELEAQPVPDDPPPIRREKEVESSE